MNTQAWIWMVGLRVLDVGLLVVWLVWFFRLRDDDDSSEDEGGGGGGGPQLGPGPGSGGGGLGEPRNVIRLPAAYRLRGHRPGHRSERRRGVETVPRPMPVRVRRPRPPLPSRRTV
ncbi:MAG: hypothetical protein H0V03_08480 [Thermoleophilaceae bacterium]|nr:hypothetical protein [Thermoleophilaceae bacterium]